MTLPANKEEFHELLESHKAANPQAWVGENRGFDRRDAIEFLFLQMVWNCLENPHRSSASPESLKRAQSGAPEQSPNPESEVADILQRMVSAGIAPEDISKVISFKQQEVVLAILYALDDSSFGQFEQHQEDLHLGVFEMDKAGTAIPGTRWGSIDHRFYDAVPKSFASVIPRAYLEDQ